MSATREPPCAGCASCWAVLRREPFLLPLRSYTQHCSKPRYSAKRRGKCQLRTSRGFFAPGTGLERRRARVLRRFCGRTPSRSASFPQFPYSPHNRSGSKRLRSDGPGFSGLWIYKINKPRPNFVDLPDLLDRRRPPCSGSQQRKSPVSLLRCSWCAAVAAAPRYAATTSRQRSPLGLAAWCSCPRSAALPSPGGSTHQRP